MRTFEKGKDLTVKWKFVTSNKELLSLSGFSASLRYKTTRGCCDVSSLTIPVNEDGKTFSSVVWSFLAGEQFAVGKYDLELTLSRNGRKVCKFIYANAFELIEDGMTQPSPTEASIEESNTLELESTFEWWVLSSKENYLDVLRAQLIGGDIDTSQSDTINGAKKYSDEKNAELETKIRSTFGDKLDGIQSGSTAIEVLEDGSTVPTIVLVLSKDGNVKLTEASDGLSASVDVISKEQIDALLESLK